MGILPMVPHGQDGRATSRQDYPLLAIVGPTASGKSALALAIARRWNGEIINFDAMQVYRGFDIGTGKLRPEDRLGVPHHLLDFAEPEQTFTAGEFARAARAILEEVRKRAKLPILVGGTGLYLRALLDGLFEGPKRSEAVRARLRKTADRKGKLFLHSLLCRLDPPAAARIAPRDTQKVIRALEVRLLTGEPITALHARGRVPLRGFHAIKLGLDPDRAELNRRIDARVVSMFRGGLIEEARSLFARTKFDGAPEAPLLAQEGSREARGRLASPFTSLGYPQAIAEARGTITIDEAIRRTQAATRRYAKRQRTWFRREPGVTWFTGFGDDAATQARICAWLENASPPR